MEHPKKQTDFFFAEEILQLQYSGNILVRNQHTLIIGVWRRAWKLNFQFQQRQWVTGEWSKRIKFTPFSVLARLRLVEGKKETVGYSRRCRINWMWEKKSHRSHSIWDKFTKAFCEANNIVKTYIPSQCSCVAGGKSGSNSGPAQCTAKGRNIWKRPDWVSLATKVEHWVSSLTQLQV